MVVRVASEVSAVLGDVRAVFPRVNEVIPDSVCTLGKSDED